MLVLSGARKRTSGTSLESETHITPILLKLHELSMIHRCRNYDSAPYLLMNDKRLGLRSGPKPKKKGRAIALVLETHPYHQLRLLAAEHLAAIRVEIGTVAYEAKWQNPALRDACLKEFHQRFSLVYAQRDWAAHQSARASQGKFRYPAHEGKFGEHTLKFYFGMPREQSTVSEMMRTGHIPLKSCYDYRKVTGFTDGLCRRCNEHWETVEHLLCHCKALSAERQLLHEAAGHVDYKLFMTVDLELASAWALRYFEMEQFEHVKNRQRYQFPRKRTHFVRIGP